MEDDNGGDEANAPLRPVNNSRGRKSDYSNSSIRYNPISSHFDWLLSNKNKNIIVHVFLNTKLSKIIEW